MGIANVRSKISYWYYMPKKNENKLGAQIDLVDQDVQFLQIIADTKRINTGSGYRKLIN